MTAPVKAKNGTAKRKIAPYFWFQGASVRALVDQLTAAGPDSARLEVRIEKKRMLFRVVGEGATAVAAASDINDSFLCPPRCPPK